MDTEKYMNELIRILHRADRYSDIEKVLRNAVIDGMIMQRSDLISYICGDYIILDRLRYGTEQKIEILKALSKKMFRIFPQYVDSISIEDYCILITRIPGMNGKELIPIYKEYSLLSEEEKNCAYRDVQRLIENGLLSYQMIRGDYAWFLTPDTNRLVVPNWDLIQLSKNAEDCKKVLKNVHYVLFKKVLVE